MSGRIAIIGLACEYPDAASPGQLWENVLTQRRAFRRLPAQRTSLADYWSADPAAPDRFYSDMAAVIEGYEFDRVAFAIAGSTYRATDLTHWLALDVAARALADAGFPGGTGLPFDTTGVIVGNTLTGEFARANGMRLRWPYVRRTIAATLADDGWDTHRITDLLAVLEERYKAPFPPVDEDTLAGGLSNTIAGRICNHFDLKGGGYTVDGACSSSLLSVATACTALTDHDLDVAVAGGVDLSIDPFELVGFAKVGAVTASEMRIYDQDDSGFWPGEGCGMTILMREEDATARGLSAHGLISGWGVSSDGSGGITRPEVAGYRLAMRRAYARAGYGPDTIPYFEGHSTGTRTGDDVELRAIAAERGDAWPAAIGSIKALIGHTKAACGIAGLIKATLAVREQVIPPTAGCVDPHPLMALGTVALRPSAGESWPAGLPVRAGVTSMGFGGINTHVVVEGANAAAPTHRAQDRTGMLLRSAQDCELLLFDADDRVALRARLADRSPAVDILSYAELGDLAAGLHEEYTGRRWRAAIVATTPADAADALQRLVEAIDNGEERLAGAGGAFLGLVTRPAKVGLLFPGQGVRQGFGTGSSPDDRGGALIRRFADIARFYATARLVTGDDPTATEVAQPSIVAASLAGLRVLGALGVEASVAVGHSVGELAALHWAGGFDEAATLRIATARGRAMADLGDTDGAMAGIAAAEDRVVKLLGDERVVVAGLNGPRQTVISGPATAIERIGARAHAEGLDWNRLAVSHAFHSPLVAAAAPALVARLAGESLLPLRRQVISTVTGDKLAADADLVALLNQQVTQPVRFAEAVDRAAAEVAMFVEVGPGEVLTRLTAQICSTPVLPLDTASRSLGPLLHVVAAAVVHGVPIRTGALFDERFARALRRDTPLTFFTNPCETAPVFDHADATDATDTTDTTGPTNAAAPDATIDLLRSLVAERAELPTTMLRPGTRPLDDLHLSSITVGQIVNTAAARLGLSTLAPTTGFATATLGELAQVLDDLAAAASLGTGARPLSPAGAGPWVRPFSVELVKAPRPTATRSADGTWTVVAPAGHPLAGRLRSALESARIGEGVLICLPADCETADIGLLLDGARTALKDGVPRRCVVVQHGRGGTAFAKTLHLEAPQVATCVIDVRPGTHPGDVRLIDWVVAEAAATTSFTEVMLDDIGDRSIPVLRPLPITDRAEERWRLDSTDVILVTGGGKGITAECARALALDGGAALAVLGRSDPATDPELAANLERLRTSSIRHRYVQADVTVPEQVETAVATVRATLGEVTAVLHGAGHNEPTGLADLAEDAFLRTVAPKIDGLRAVLRAVDPAALRLLVTFGSIIGRTGLRGQADYATANEWLTDLTVSVGRDHPNCRCLAIEWSVWSGIGMGERLGVIESLVRDGITPISPDAGIALLRRLIADPRTPTVTVVTGRLDGLPTVTVETTELPLMRFVDKPLVHYPSIELVTETTLSHHDDPYLDDHRFEGDPILPAVLGLEAMTQVAAAVSLPDTALRQGCAQWDDVEFLRPIVVPPEETTTIRVAALAHEAGLVDVVIRSSETGFAADHVRGVYRLGPPAVHRLGTQATAITPAEPPPVSLSPADLYRDLLFQGSRFQRVTGYRRLTSTGCVAEVSGAETTAWFASALPDRLVLGDPGPRDAFMHAIQVCVPDAVLLPIGVERIVTTDRPWPARLLVTATECDRGGDTYVYRVTVLDEAGDLVEEWHGLSLRAVRRRDGGGPWLAPLLGPFLQRRLAELLPDGLSGVAVEPERPGERVVAAARVLGRALGRRVTLRHRGDGRPEVTGSVSLSHGPGLVFAVAAADSDDRVGCDVEAVVDRPGEWADLLGADRDALTRLVAAELAEPEAVAATRVWSAIECVVKAGGPATAPLTVLGDGSRGRSDGWALFAAGAARVATFVTTLTHTEGPVVFAVLTGGDTFTEAGTERAAPTGEEDR